MRTDLPSLRRTTATAISLQFPQAGTSQRNRSGMPDPSMPRSVRATVPPETRAESVPMPGKLLPQVDTTIWETMDWDSRHRATRISAGRWLTSMMSVLTSHSSTEPSHSRRTPLSRIPGISCTASLPPQQPAIPLSRAISAPCGTRVSNSPSEAMSARGTSTGRETSTSPSSATS